MNKTIAIFAAYCFPHLGGIETYIDNLMKEFQKLNYRIVLVTTEFNEKLDYVENDNFRIIRLPIYNIFKDRYPIIKHNSLEKALIKQLDDYSISAIIVNTRFHLTSHIGAKYGHKKNIPVLLIEHGSSYVTLNNKFIDFFANRYEKFLTKRIKKNVDGFYGVSNRCNEWLKKLDNINANGIFYNSIDANIYKQYEKEIVPDKKINITYAGRILVEKGIVNLLEAFKKLDNSNCVLNVAGDGPILDSLKEKYSSDNVKFFGKLDHDEVIKLLAKTDIFVYPSMYPEGLPTSVLEAGLMKCAIIATDRGGTKEVINDSKYGIIVDENVEDLLDRLNYLISNPGVIDGMKNNIHDRIMSSFTWNETVNVIIKEIEKYEKQES